ncbi:MAG: flagellar protein FlgJ [Betaproteobacteria bacterium]|nr:flagellar protein FlgJ [Betaproteobacteria bacterium]
MGSISKSVGQRGVNIMADVKKVQQLLNYSLHLLRDTKHLLEDGHIGSKTVNAIREYQKIVLQLLKPDGLVSPNGPTVKRLEQTARKPRPKNVEDFIAKTLPAAKKVKATYGVPIAVLIAQAALESGWGTSVKNNAYFGIKGKSPSGGATTFTTTEYVNGKKVTIQDSFRAYTDFADAADDYGRFLSTNPRYKDCFTVKNDPLAFADKLQAAGYATDPAYASKLKSIITTYYLADYDK